MKRILHIPNYYSPHIGGIEQTAQDCVNSLKEIYEQEVLCFNHEKNDSIDIVDGIKVIRAGTFKKVSSQALSLSFGKMLKQEINSFKPDFIVFHYPNPFIAHFLLKYKKKDFKLILYWHLDITKQKILGRLFNGQTNALLKRANVIVATSPNYIAGSPYLSKFKNKCEVIPSCINETRLHYNNCHLSQSTNIKRMYNNKIICFAFGRHVEYKGLKYLIQSAKKLSDDFVVLIGGSGPLTRKLKKQAIGESNIIFLGRLSDDDLKAYFLACDIFCFPSITKNEAFGLGLAEAMFYGKPSITFEIPGSGVNYVNLKNITGLEVENRNVMEYTKAIEKLSNEKALLEFYSKNARKRAEELFKFETYKLNIINLFKEVSLK